MKNLNYKVILAAVLIDIIGTTVVQVFLNSVTSDFYILVTGGSLMSVLAGYYVVLKSNKKIDNNLFVLSAITFFAGFAILFYHGTYVTTQVFWLFLTPILNGIGGLLAQKRG